ncbi:hypothetical protein [Microvirga massiliensis]|uniref:hypothetical protein n=1 Tax=Microvirga massiliensis TaxID=1033741 RepID=UPI00062BBA51|nr:hypothetical protein [Microvirga massiliensis]
MRILILSILTAIVLAIAAASVLSSMQQPAYEAYATSSVRVGDPGSNLVGSDGWGSSSQSDAPHER